MITVCAGRLTPQARVAVETNTDMWPFEKRSSTKFLSFFDKPAWWNPMPVPNNAWSSKQLTYDFKFYIILQELSEVKISYKSAITDCSRKSFAVLMVSLREWTNIII